MFDAATIAVVAQGFVIGPMLFYLVRYLQQVLDASPLGASGINNTAPQVGIAIGLGALGAFFQRRLESTLMIRLATPPVDARQIARLAARAACQAPWPPRRHQCVEVWQRTALTFAVL